MSTNHNHQIRVYWEDTDGGGVVYHSNYLNFAERARTEWLRERGHNQSDLHQHTGIVFVMRDCHIRYKNPAKLDDLLDVSVAVRHITRHKIQFVQRVMRGAVCCAELTVELAAVDGKTGRLAEVPDDILAAASVKLEE